MRKFSASEFSYQSCNGYVTVVEIVDGEMWFKVKNFRGELIQSLTMYAEVASKFIGWTLDNHKELIDNAKQRDSRVR